MNFKKVLIPKPDLKEISADIKNRCSNLAEEIHFFQLMLDEPASYYDTDLTVGYEKIKRSFLKIKSYLPKETIANFHKLKPRVKEIISLRRRVQIMKKRIKKEALIVPVNGGFPEMGAGGDLVYTERPSPFQRFLERLF